MIKKCIKGVSGDSDINESYINYIPNEDINVVNKGSHLEHHFIGSSSNDIIGIIVDNNKYINTLTKIGKGSSGFIYKFKNIDITKKESYVIKKYIEKKDYMVDKMISIILYNINLLYNAKLNVIPSYWNDTNKVTIMDGCEGDLYNLVYRRPSIIYDPINIFLQVCKSIAELYDYGIYYCDLKLSNILYNIKDSNIKCVLCDIGSIFFKKNNFYTNIFADDQLINNIIILKPIKDTSNYCSLGFEHNCEDNIFGFTEVTNELYHESFSTHIFKIISIEPKSVILKSELNNTFIINKMYVTLDCSIFTFPHIMNPDGIINIYPHMKEEEIDITLINNIFHSLGVFLIELICHSDFGLRFSTISKCFRSSKVHIISYIDYKTKLKINQKSLLKEILFGDNIKPGLINNRYINYPSVIDEFKHIINKVSLLKTE